MADYIEVFDEGTDVTYTAASAITAGQLVGLTAAMTVAPTTGPTVAWAGVASTDAAAGARVGVVSGGVQELVASGAIAVGDLVAAAAAGKGATFGANTNYAQSVGLALTAAADGAKVRTKFNR